MKITSHSEYQRDIFKRKKQTKKTHCHNWYLPLRIQKKTCVGFLKVNRLQCFDRVKIFKHQLITDLMSKPHK